MASYVSPRNPRVSAGGLPLRSGFQFCPLMIRTTRLVAARRGTRFALVRARTLIVPSLPTTAATKPSKLIPFPIADRAGSPLALCRGQTLRSPVFSPGDPPRTERYATTFRPAELLPRLLTSFSSFGRPLPTRQVFPP